MRRDLPATLAASLSVCALALALAAPGAGQGVAPAPVQTPPVASPLPMETAPPGWATPGPTTSPGPIASPTPAPAATPTYPPISTDPTSVDLVYHQTATIRVMGVLGQVHATSTEPQIVQIQDVDQSRQQIAIYGEKLGIAHVVIADDRGVSTSVWVRVAYQAGFPADYVETKITGDPATADYVRRAAAAAAAQAASNLRPGAKVQAVPGEVQGARDLPLDDVETVRVPVAVSGDPYITVRGTTTVRVENYAQPRIKPISLLVSDYPETITENGVLFSETLQTNQPARFLYYHYNEPGSADRRILLKLTNDGDQPALVQYISGPAAPTPYVLEGGHLSTMRFLVHVARNEGTVVTVPAKSTINLIDQEFPAGTLISNLLQLRELNGKPLQLTLLVQNFDAPVDSMPAGTTLLQSKVKHARGVYPIPEFFFDYTYFVGSSSLEVPIGEIPLPNLRRGEALGGDYGVLQSITITMVNRTNQAAPLALYENPHGGTATATYVIDGNVVLSHPVKAFTKYMVRQYLVPAHGFVRTKITTMPEGGSSYPLYLIVAPDDGSVAPGAPGSPIS